MSPKRWFPHPLFSVFLLVLWLLMVNSVAPGHLLLGALLGWFLPLLTKNFLVKVPPLKRPVALLLFLLKVVVDIVLANLQVARLVLGSPKKLSPAFIEVPMAIEDEFVLSVLTSVVSLTPGTVSAGLSPDHRYLLLHALDAPEPQQVIDEIKQRYEAPLQEIFACSAT